MASPDLFTTGNEHLSAGQFQFISLHVPDDAKDRNARRLARSHAVKQALEKKRKLEQKSRSNFRVTTWQDGPKGKRGKNKCTNTSVVTTPLSSLSEAVLDPFQTLAVKSPRLKALLYDYNARQAIEPVFSIVEDLAFHNFHAVFRTGLVEPALANAVMLSLAFAVTGGSINAECLGYQGQAITHIREQMKFPDLATSESTIGAILLLTGVEARLGKASRVELHMGAVQQLLEICQASGVHLTGGIKRSVFWQDLNSSILTGSKRIIDHKTFDELHWSRDLLPTASVKLPRGFEIRSHLFSKEFIEILEDLHALQCLREAPVITKGDPKAMRLVNNHTASIQSRLVDMPHDSHVSNSFQLAAYLSSVMLCCTIWCALVIPAHVSLQLLHELQQARDDPVWEDHPDLLLWLIYIGGAFAPVGGPVRSGYLNLLSTNNIPNFRGKYESWPELSEVLNSFIWSDIAFLPYMKKFWEETVI